MTDDDLLKLDNQLCHRFYSVSNAFTRAYRPLLQKMDITYPQYLVLLVLWEHKQLTISELVEKSRIDPGGLTLILKKLEQKGYVHIQPSEQDKRVKQVVLTTKGKAAAMKAVQPTIPDDASDKDRERLLAAGLGFDKYLDDWKKRKLIP